MQGPVGFQSLGFDILLEKVNKLEVKVTKIEEILAEIQLKLDDGVPLVD
jgi:hypothetical protein